MQNYIRYNSGYSYPLRKSRVVKHILVHQASYKVKYTKLELMSETNFASFLHSTKRPIQGSCHSSLIGYWGKISRRQACCYLIVQQCFPLKTLQRRDKRYEHGMKFPAVWCSADICDSIKYRVRKVFENRTLVSGTTEYLPQNQTYFYQILRSTSLKVYFLNYSMNLPSAAMSDSIRLRNRLHARVT